MTHMKGDIVVSLSKSLLLVKDIEFNKYEIPDFYAHGFQEKKKLDLFI